MENPTLCPIFLKKIKGNGKGGNGDCNQWVSKGQCSKGQASTFKLDSEKTSKRRLEKANQTLDHYLTESPIDTDGERTETSPLGTHDKPLCFKLKQEKCDKEKTGERCIAMTPHRNAVGEPHAGQEREKNASKGAMSELDSFVSVSSSSCAAHGQSATVESSISTCSAHWSLSSIGLKLQEDCMLSSQTHATSTHVMTRYDGHFCCSCALLMCACENEVKVKCCVMCKGGQPSIKCAMKTVAEAAFVKEVHWSIKALRTSADLLMRVDAFMTLTNVAAFWRFLNIEPSCFLVFVEVAPLFGGQFLLANSEPDSDTH